MVVDGVSRSSDFQIGIEADDELDSALTNVINKAEAFDTKFGELKSYFNLTGGESHLWIGKDADTFREVVTRSGGIIDKLNKFSEQMNNMGSLAKELRRVITEAKNKLAENIKAIDGGE